MKRDVAKETTRSYWCHSLSTLQERAWSLKGSRGKPPWPPTANEIITILLAWEGLLTFRV